MEIKWPLDDLDSAYHQLELRIDALDAIYDAMTNGPGTAESYTNALFGICCCIRDTMEEMREHIDACFKESKLEANNGTKGN